VKKIIYISLFVLAVFAPKTYAQWYYTNVYNVDTGFMTGALIRSDPKNSDTVPHVWVREITIFPQHEFKNKREANNYGRLLYNVKKVYPYSLIIRRKYKEISDKLATIPNEREQKKYVKQAEQELRGEFEGQLTKLTYTQGRILLKLVDRQTGETTYQILKDWKGSFSAIFWQSIAVVFGSNLNAEYDPTNDDKLIEEIVIKIEQGQL